jgi:hypothetical protein
MEDDIKRILQDKQFHLQLKSEQKDIIQNEEVHCQLVRDSSAVQRLFVQLAGAVERQSALHKENSGFATPTLGRHISTFRGYRPPQIEFLMIFIHVYLLHFYLCADEFYSIFSVVEKENLKT